MKYENYIKTDIKLWFDDPVLTHKLINITNPKRDLLQPLKENATCTIMLTSISILYELFVTTDEKKLCFFSLRSFDNIQTIYSDMNEDNARPDSHILVCLIQNKIKKCELELNNIEYMLPSFENITTIGSNSDPNNFKIVHVSDGNDTWLSGSSSISQLSNSSIVPLRQSKKIDKFFHSCKDHKKIKVLNISNIRKDLSRHNTSVS